MRRATRWGAAAVAAGSLALVAACTSGPPPDAERAGTVVVAVTTPFLSLNGGTVAGRSPGSTLVRGLASAGFVTLDAAGAAVPDPAFGTVEKVADAPLTVRYTIGEDATWSDGTPVTPADLLLEWAARSGQLDDVVPEVDARGAVTNEDALDAGVAFAATSPALLHAEQTPTVDGSTVTVVYDTPVADWPVALDVGVPAHVVGEEALDEQDADAAAAAVADAITTHDTARLSPIARTWRTAFTADALVEHPERAVTTGAYRVDRVGPGEQVELVPSDAYRGPVRAAYDRVVVRSDLHPLDMVPALVDGEVDVVAPAVSSDVLAALDDADGVERREGGDATLQLELQTGGGGAFDPATYGGDAAVATAVRTAFLRTVPRDDLVGAVTPLWPQAAVQQAFLPSVGPEAGVLDVPTGADVAGAADVLAAAGVTSRVTVRVLTSTDDPVRARMLDDLTASAKGAGFDVEPYDPADGPATDLGGAPDTWDAALVPVPQAEPPVASVAERWRTGGGANVTHWSDATLDAALDGLTTTIDPAQATAALDGVARQLAAGGAVLPVVRSPALVAWRTADPATADRLPTLRDVPVLETARADLTAWWDWARTPAS